MITLLFFAFLSGLVTIAAPCIWPLLPIVLSASAVGGDHRRALGVTLGILLSFGILTISISYLVSFLNFDPNILRLFAVIILVFLGLTLLVPPLSRIVEVFVSRFAGVVGSKTNTSGGFLPGFVTGLALGIVWTPCAGPILATIATLSATRAVGPEIILVTVVYLVGVGIPLFVFSYAGQHLISKSRTLNKYTPVIQKIFGAIIILTALLIFTNYDKVFAAKLLDTFPGYSKFVTDLESNDFVKNQLDVIRGRKDMENIGKPYNPMPNTSRPDLFNANSAAPEFSGIIKWLNLPSGQTSLSLNELKGKVVLIDFWTYTCINCIRTLPHITSWYDKYKDDGLVVVGVHTPEFEFEKKTSNVEGAIRQYKIHYPVAQDNNFSTWNAYNNHYWPAKYLIDKDGIVRYFHFGEGEYGKTEEAIRVLLEEAGGQITDPTSNVSDQTPWVRNSPETYLGSARMQYYYPGGNLTDGSHSLTLSKSISVNSFTLGGNWIVSDEYSESVEDAVLEYNFSASKVFLVMKPKNSGGAKVRILLDGKVVDTSNQGADVRDGFMPITSDRLYELIDLKNKPGQHILRLEFTPGIQVFAFTFG